MTTTFTNTKRHADVIAHRPVDPLGQIKLSKKEQERSDIAARIEEGSLMEVPSSQTEESDAKALPTASEKTTAKKGDDS